MEDTMTADTHDKKREVLTDASRPLDASQTASNAEPHEAAASPRRINISTLSPRQSVGGTWVEGTIRNYRFSALVFPEHAAEPAWELGQSRISKLALQSIDTGLNVYSWERGLDIPAKDDEVQCAVDSLVHELANRVFGDARGVETIPAHRPPNHNRVPRIYVASLADYNAGRLSGKWIEADQPAETIHREIAAMLAQSSEPFAEEWAIHDYENFGSLRLSEFADIQSVADAAALIAEHGEVFAELLGYLGGLSSLEEAKKYMEQAYRGAFDDVEDYVREFVEDCYGDVIAKLPDFLRYHIDYQGIAHDLECGGDIFTLNCGGKVHVFDAHL
jgi:antirestriction protein